MPVQRVEEQQAQIPAAGRSSGMTRVRKGQPMATNIYRRSSIGRRCPAARGKSGVGTVDLQRQWSDTDRLDRRPGVSVN